jgi:hypothetical protein
MVTAPAEGAASMTSEVHPVDQILPTPRLLALGLQHVLVMYAFGAACVRRDDLKPAPNRQLRHCERSEAIKIKKGT